MIYLHPNLAACYNLTDQRGGRANQEYNSKGTREKGIALQKEGAHSSLSCTKEGSPNRDPSPLAISP